MPSRLEDSRAVLFAIHALARSSADDHGAGWLCWLHRSGPGGEDDEDEADEAEHEGAGREQEVSMFEVFDTDYALRPHCPRG